ARELEGALEPRRVLVDVDVRGLRLDLHVGVEGGDEGDVDRLVVARVVRAREQEDVAHGLLSGGHGDGEAQEGGVPRAVGGDGRDDGRVVGVAQVLGVIAKERGAEGDGGRVARRVLDGERPRGRLDEDVEVHRVVAAVGVARGGELRVYGLLARAVRAGRPE